MQLEPILPDYNIPYKLIKQNPETPPPKEQEITIQTGLVKGPNYGQEGEKRDAKTHSVYQKVKFYQVDDKKFMEIEKRKGTQIVKKVYQEKKLLGSGTYGDAYLYENVPKTNGEMSKPKVVKVPKGEDAKESADGTYWLLKEQLTDPATGEQVLQVPGLQRKFKIMGKEGESVQPFYNEGELANFLGKLPANEMINATAQLIFGLNHLHTETEMKPGRAHRDIKPENILVRVNSEGQFEFALIDLDDAHLMSGVDGQYTASDSYYHSNDQKITDNEVSAWSSFKSLFSKKTPRTYRDYSDQEKSQFNSAHDIYSLGLSLRHLLVGRAVQFNEKELIKPLTINDLLMNKQDLSPDQTKQLEGICNLVNAMTNSDWTQRPTSSAALVKLSDLGIEIPKYVRLT